MFFEYFTYFVLSMSSGFEIIDMCNFNWLLFNLCVNGVSSVIMCFSPFRLLSFFLSIMEDEASAFPTLPLSGAALAGGSRSPERTEPARLSCFPLRVAIPEFSCLKLLDALPSFTLAAFSKSLVLFAVSI